MRQRLVDIDGLKFSLPFAGQDMQETLSLFIKSLLLHVPTCKMPNLLDTYNTYIEYIEEAIFCRLTIRSSALERYTTRQG
jgi:hypothetical protein